jgi:hypothetical protein
LQYRSEHPVAAYSSPTPRLVTRSALIGDYGTADQASADVAAWVLSLQPDFIASLCPAMNDSMI